MNLIKNYVTHPNPQYSQAINLIEYKFNIIVSDFNSIKINIIHDTIVLNSLHLPSNEEHILKSKENGSIIQASN